MGSMIERMLFLDLETNLKGDCVSKAGSASNRWAAPGVVVDGGTAQVVVERTIGRRTL
jgi:hypothetical protein